MKKHILLTPAAARYIAHGHPRPPMPTIRTLPFLSFACPEEIKSMIHFGKRSNFLKVQSTSVDPKYKIYVYLYEGYSYSKHIKAGTSIMGVNQHQLGFQMTLYEHNCKYGKRTHTCPPIEIYLVNI